MARQQQSQHIDMGDKTLQTLADRLLQLDDLIEKENDKAMVDADTQAFVQSMGNPNTERKTTGDVKNFIEFLIANDDMRKPEELSPSELDLYLARFFMDLKIADGSDYEPHTLKGMQGSINRYLYQKNVKFNIIEDREFMHSREVLSSKRKLLRQHRKGNKVNRTDPFTREELNMLYDGNQLGTGNPRALINTMYMNNTLHFGMRSRLEHEHLKWGDIKLKTTSTGEEYLEYTERITKTRTGHTDDSRGFLPKMFEDKDNPRCPVAAYKVFAARRSVTMLDDESPFYIGVKRMKSENDSWFVNQPMGKNTMGAIVKTMCNAVGITGRKVNHRVRKTAITSLVHAGIAPSIVQQLSGHKSISSINNYSVASSEQQKTMSSILTNYSCSKSANPGAISPPTPSEFSPPYRDSQEIVESFLNDITAFECNEMQQKPTTMPLNTEGHPPSVVSSTSKNFNCNSEMFPYGNFLSGANITGNVIFQFGGNAQRTNMPQKRHINCIESDSNSD